MNQVEEIRAEVEAFNANGTQGLLILKSIPREGHPLGYVHKMFGLYFQEPTVGQVFKIYRGENSFMETSLVTKIVRRGKRGIRFQTENSTYVLRKVK